QAIVYVCTLAWQMSFWSSMQGATRSGQAAGFAALGALGMFLPVMVLIIAFTQVGIGTLTAAVSTAYLQQEVSLREAYQVVRSRLGRLLGATLLNSLMIWLGFILCIIPGIYFSLWYLLVSEVVVLENLGASAALR